MKAQLPARSRARDRQFRPQLEALESRWCPSASITVSGHTMIIKGDALADQITIRDDGDGGVSASIVSAAGKVTGSGSAITHVEVYAGKGSDMVDFALTNTLATNLDLDVHLGAGNDQANLNFADGIKGSHVKVDVDGGAGNDQVSAQLGNVTDSYVQLTGCLGRGADSFNLGFKGDVTGDSDVGIHVNGGKGNDSLHVNAAGLDIGAHSKVAVELNGGYGADNLGLTYDGVLKGKLTVKLNGGPGNDTIVGNLTAEVGSTGTLNAVEHAGTGHNNLTLNVNDNSNPGGKSKLADLDAVMYGEEGRDIFTHTPNVKVIS
jgi:hypothetical protein